jgi:hypothetical protein
VGVGVDVDGIEVALAESCVPDPPIGGSSLPTGDESICAPGALFRPAVCVRDGEPRTNTSGIDSATIATIDA